MNDWFFTLSLVENPGTKELQQFVDEVMRFLAFVLEDSESELWRYYPELRQQAVAVYETELKQAASELHATIPDITQESLNQHGLTGAGARFKYNVIAAVARRWEGVRRHPTVRKTFRRVVEAIDAHLDSLISAAGGVGGIIKEFKDALLALTPE